MNYEYRFNLFLKSKSDMERNFICNYRENKNKKNLLEYSCVHNLYKWLKLIKYYCNEDLLEYYSKCECIKLNIFKLLFKKYKSLYLQNVVLYSCNSNVIEYLLYFDNNNYFSFNILIETGNIELLKMFINYGYKIQNYEIEMIVMKNITFSTIFNHINNWINKENKNIFYIFKYCNNTELIDFLKKTGLNFNKFDDLEKDILMYSCENLNINIELLKIILEIINFNNNRTDSSGYNALFYYCLNPRFNQEIFNYLQELNLKLDSKMIKKLLDVSKNPKIFKNLESYNLDLLPYKYDLDILSNDLNSLQYFEERYNLYNYIDIKSLIFRIIENSSYDCLKFILEKYPTHIFLRDEYENTILDLVCNHFNKNLDIIKFLVNNGVNVYNKNIFGLNCIFNLLNSENVDIKILTYLLKITKIQHSYNNNFETLYHVISKLNLNLSYLKLVGNYNINHNLLDKFKNTALNYALINQNFNNVKYFFKFNNMDLYSKNKLGFNSLDYFLKLKFIDNNLLIKYEKVTLKNIENYISTNNLNVKIFAYLISKMKNKYNTNKEGNNILLFLCKTNLNSTKLKIRLFEILRYNNFNFNKFNKNYENSLILTMKYEPNYYLVKYLLDLKVSTFMRDNYGNNALMYCKDIRLYNLLNKYSIKRKNHLGQTILLRLFNINYLNYKFIFELCKKYDLSSKDFLNKTALDYFIENNNDDIELFDYLLNFIKLKNKHINIIFWSRNRNLCLYLLHNKKIDPNYLDNNGFGVLDYFSFDKEIVNFIKYKYLYKIKNKNIVVTDEKLLIFIDNIDNYILKIEDINLKKKVISDYILNNETIYNLLGDESLFETILTSVNKLDNYYYKDSNILIILLKYKYKLETIKILINHIDLDINYLDNKKQNILFYSLYDINILKYLINLGSDYKICNNNYESLLYYTVINNYNTLVIEYLINFCKLDVNHKNVFNISMIFKTKNYEIIKILLENGLRTDHKDEHRNSFLNYYLQQSDININIINLCIKFNYNFNSINNNHCTPLINFIKNYDRIDILSIILKYQNTINLKDLTGNTALMLVIKNYINPQMVHILLKNNADPNILDNYNRNCLYYCNDDNYLPIIKELINNNIDYNLIIDNRNYLIYYTWWYMEETVKYLIQNFKDIDLNYVDSNGNNALFYATGIYSDQGNLDIIKFLHQNGVNVNHVNINGYNLLFVAAGASGYNYYDNDILIYYLNYLNINHLDNENNNFINYLKQEYLEDLINEKVLSNKDPMVIEIIYSKDIKKLLPYEIELEPRDMKDQQCGICFENFEKDDILNICHKKHIFHRNCLIKWYQESGKIKCPYCTLKFTLNHQAIKCL